jgi:hypothetical protein
MIISQFKIVFFIMWMIILAHWKNSFINQLEVIIMDISIEQISPYLESLTAKQKDKLIHQLLKRDKEMIERLYLEHIATPIERDERFEYYKKEVEACMHTYYRAPCDELIMAKAISNAKKIIVQFAKLDKRPEKEAELLMDILKVVFDENPAQLGTCWTKYDHSVGQTIKKLITLIKSKLHEDYLIEYKEPLESYISRLKRTSSFNDSIYLLPDTI